MRAVRTSLLGKVLLPPIATETVSAERQRQTALAHAFVAFSTALFDVALYFMLRNVPSLRADMVRLFTEVAIPLLAGSGLLTLVGRRRPHRFYKLVQIVCLVAEAASMVFWIQLTGTISSYFLIMAIVLIVSYRLGYDYWLGLSCLIIVAGLHGLAFTLEELGIIRRVGLFNADPGAIYSSSAFRFAAFSSISWCYVMSFFTANYLAEALKQKDLQLRHMQRDLDIAEKKAQIGRLSGQTLNKQYEIGELLGRGGMGEVYQARRLSDGRELAVKVLLSDAGQDQTIRERFRREAEVIAKLPAEHVAGFVEMGHSDEGDFLVMELLQGEDLGAVLRRRGRLGVDELKSIVEGIAEALAAAHERGVIHRDLKPPNVFIDTEGKVRLLDFGIARLLENESRTLTMTSVVLGTPGFLAPEQAKGLIQEIGPHTDVFAFGAIVYRSITGRAAFPSRNPVAAAYEAVCHHPTAPSTLVPELSPAIDAVIALAMAKAITDRYPSAKAFASDLLKAFDGKLPEDVPARARALAEAAPTAEAHLAIAATVAGTSRRIH
jgi:predicted Ser/Thr protein kinase